MNNRYDLQGHTFTCGNCNTEHKKFHPAHIYCSPVCMWEVQDKPMTKKTCKSCGCTDTIRDRKGNTYTCGTCRKLMLNPDRTDVIRRDPTDYIDSGLRTYS